METKTSALPEDTGKMLVDRRCLLCRGRLATGRPQISTDEPSVSMLIFYGTHCPSVVTDCADFPTLFISVLRYDLMDFWGVTQRCALTAKSMVISLAKDRQ
ncbi:hypothetical protein HAX54_036752 [Datura stramonium]|uniref:Uncharacterized protein n=1 Tax=Datura stramonium TaxID=4076 RepID=A0ABS8VIL1_DATST|nr:hypothetical protein [Datura stramonium]